MKKLLKKLQFELKALQHEVTTYDENSQEHIYTLGQIGGLNLAISIIEKLNP